MPEPRALQGHWRQRLTRALAVQTHALTRAFDQRVAVAALELEIPRGVVFGFLGPNGAGKTTTVRMLTALIAPTTGRAEVLGLDIAEAPNLVRARVGLLTEAPGLYDRLSAEENLRYFGELHGLRAAVATQRARALLKTFDLDTRRDEGVGGFSKGMRQKLAIARALVHEPELVFLDEPTSGLDPDAARTVRDLVRQLRADGRTVFLTTHNLAEADELCDVIGIFQTRLLAHGSPAALRKQLFGARTRVRLAGDCAAWRDGVAALPFVREVVARGADLEVVTVDPDTHNPALVRHLALAGAEVRWVEPQNASLEEAYLHFVKAPHAG